MSDWESENNPGWGAPKKPVASGSGEPVQEGRLIEKLVQSLQSEQRKSRRWGIFFKLLTFVYLFALLFLLNLPIGDEIKSETTDHTAVIDVEGPIAADKNASADNIIGSLRAAFDNESAKAVILRINSPGGSPVQAGYVYDEIKRLRALHPDKKVYAVVADIGASGAYYIAAAADEIYADKASLVGSIGVIAGGFGFTGIMDKLGVERRLYTSGEHKAFLDPFSPEKDSEVAFWKQVLDTTHRQFIEQVKKGRGDRLADDPKLFSGLIWTGEQALKLGLVDGLGSARYVAREVVGQKQMVDYTHKSSRIQQLVERFGASAGGAALDQLLESRMELR